MSTARNLLALFLLCAACSKEEAKKPLRSTETFPASAKEPAPSDPGVEFVEVEGIAFRHVTGAYGRKYLPETMGSGVGILDYDSDGDPDLLFVQGNEWPSRRKEPQPTMRLYRNEGGFRFADATAGSGLEVPCYGMGVAIADYDADGKPDVYVTCLERNLLFRNAGGRFEQVAAGPDGGRWKDAKGNEHWSWSTGAGWFDADGDGDLDLAVVNYVRWTEETDVYAQLVEGVKAYTRPQLYDGDQPRLYLQEADGTFRDATQGSGLDATKDAGKSLGLCFDDFDGDGRADIFVANDTVQNFLFLNLGGGRFRECAVAANVAYDSDGRARAAMGIDSVDWKNDGNIAVAIGNFSEEPVSLFRVRRAAAGETVFEDDANAARIGLPTLLPLTFGLLLADVDLDGWCDLLLANGHIEPSVTRIKPEILYEQTPQYFRNLEGQRFADVSVDAGAPFRKRIVGRGLAAGDLDGDGDLDLVFTSNGGSPLLLRCDLKSKNRHLRIRLEQPGRNRDALGAVVRIEAGSVAQRRVVRSGGSYLSQGEPGAHFGLGAAARAEKVTVRWPDGVEQSFGPLDAGAHRLVRKP